MPYSSSDYDTAVSAFNVLPESMAVEELISRRQRNEIGGLSINRMKRDEETDRLESEQFNAFDEEYKKMGIAPDDYEGNAKALAQLQMRNPGNKRIKEAADALTNASESVFKGRKSKMESDEMDEYELQKPMLQETARLGIKNAFSKGKMLENDLKILQEDEDAKVTDNFSTVIGSLNEKFPDLAQKAAEWGERYGSDPEMAREVREMGKMMGGLGRSAYLEDANTHSMKVLSPSIRSIEKTGGVSLSFDLPPDQIASAYEKAKNLYAPGSKEDANAEAAIKAHSTLYNAMLSRKTLQDNLQQIVSRQDDITDPTVKKNFKVEMAGIRMKMGALVGQVDKDYRDRESQEKAIDRNRELEKDRIGVLKSMGEIKNATDRVAIAKVAVRLRAKGMKREEALDFIKTNHKDNALLKNIKTLDDVKAFDKQFTDAFDLDEEEDILGD